MKVRFGSQLILSVHLKKGRKEMAIPNDVLEKMEAMLRRGSTIAEINREYQYKYEYRDILFGVSNYGMLGAKRMISNRLRRLGTGLSDEERMKTIQEIRIHLEYIYQLAKMNGKKLAVIAKTLDSK